MSQATAGEIAFAKRVHLDPLAVAAARVVLNAIADLPWPETDRVLLLARLAHAAHADVGPILGALALQAAPVSSFETLVDLPGLGEVRVTGLVRALSNIDILSFTPDAPSLRDALARLSALESENAALRAELDRVRAALERTTPGPPTASVIRLEDLANSVSSQIATADDTLRSRVSGLRLSGVELHLSGAATSVDKDVALAFGSTGGGSAVGMRFVAGGTAANAQGDVEVPDVTGYTPALARRKLQTLGFAVAFSTLAGARGKVAEQSPGPGSLALAGSPVRLIVR